MESVALKLGALCTPVRIVDNIQMLNHSVHPLSVRLAEAPVSRETSPFA